MKDQVIKMTRSLYLLRTLPKIRRDTVFSLPVFFLLLALLPVKTTASAMEGTACQETMALKLQKISALSKKITRTKNSIERASGKRQTQKVKRLRKKLRKFVRFRLFYQSPEERTILGRWIFQGFEGAVRYEFTDTKRFTIYSDDGDFPTLEEFRERNPQLTGNDWWFEGDTVVVDLNFGNFLRLIPHFQCGNRVIDWIDENGSVHSTFYREAHDY